MSTTKKKKPAVKVLPKGRAKYPRLTTPDTKYNADGEYSIKVLYPAEEGEKLREMFEEEREKYKARLKEAKTRIFKDGSLPIDEEFVKDEATGIYELRAKQNAVIKVGDKTYHPKPAVYDAKGKIIANPEKLGISGGSVVKPIVEVVGYNTKPLGCGISLRLKGIQLIELVKYTPGGNLSELLEEEDGYEYDEYDEMPSDMPEEEPEDSSEDSDGDSDEPTTSDF